MSLGNLDGTEGGDRNLKDRKDKVLALSTYMHNYTMHACLASNSPGEAKVQESWKKKKERKKLDGRGLEQLILVEKSKLMQEGGTMSQQLIRVMRLN